MVREWKNHKYIRKEGNRYIYPEDLKRSSRSGKLVRTITDANGNRVVVRGSAATNTIANRSNRYDSASGERMSPSEYRTRQQDGSLDRMRGQVTQEAAKKQGQYSLNMMRQEKAAQQQVQRPVQRQTMVSTPANLNRRTTTTSSSQNVSTAAKQAMERAGYTGPVKRPQNQNVKSVQKTIATKETKTPEKTTKTTTSTLTTTDKDDTTKKTTSTKSTSSTGSTRSSSGSSSSGSSSTKSNSGSTSSRSSSSGSKDSRGTVTQAAGSGYTKASGGSSSRSSRRSFSKSGSNSGSSNSSNTSEISTEESKAAELADEILDKNKSVEELSKAELNILSDQLSDVLDMGKVKTKAKAGRKLEDTKNFVKMGLSILKGFKK